MEASNPPQYRVEVPWWLVYGVEEARRQLAAFHDTARETELPEQLLQEVLESYAASLRKICGTCGQMNPQSTTMFEQCASCKRTLMCPYCTHTPATHKCRARYCRTYMCEHHYYANKWSCHVHELCLSPSERNTPPETVRVRELSPSVPGGIKRTVVRYLC